MDLSISRGDGVMDYFELMFGLLFFISTMLAFGLYDE